MGCPAQLRYSRGYVAPPDCFVANLPMQTVDRILTEHRCRTGWSRDSAQCWCSASGHDPGRMTTWTSGFPGLRRACWGSPAVGTGQSPAPLLVRLEDVHQRPERGRPLRRWWYRVVRWFRGSNYPYVDVISKREAPAASGTPRRPGRRAGLAVRRHRSGSTAAALHLRPIELWGP